MFTKITHKRGLHGHDHVSNQRGAAVKMVIFHSLRVCVWMVAMAGMGLHFVLPHSHLLTSYYHACQAVAFVTFLSLYCNWSTDLSNLTAAVAALFAADSHHDAETARGTVERDAAQLERDIAQLARLRPSPEAEKLANDITSRL